MSVPHLMCRQTEGTSTSARHCCGVFRDSGAAYNTADLLTYLLGGGNNNKEEEDSDKERIEWNRMTDTCTSIRNIPQVTRRATQVLYARNTKKNYENVQNGKTLHILRHT